MIAALFVATGGCYFGLPDVDPWDEKRDARMYTGPWPVVAHPPCARWGHYWFGSPSSPKRFERGADGGCFAAALASVRRWGGVLEHPRGSSAWLAHGLFEPLRGGWSVADMDRAWTCEVEQGHFGHPARKPTWLYAVRVTPPSLPWGKSAARARIDLGAHTKEERAAIKRRGEVEQFSARKRAATPLPFRDLLLSIARSVRPVTNPIRHPAAEKAR